MSALVTRRLLFRALRNASVGMVITVRFPVFARQSGRTQYRHTQSTCIFGGGGLGACRRLLDNKLSGNLVEAIYVVYASRTGYELQIFSTHPPVVCKARPPAALDYTRRPGKPAAPSRQTTSPTCVYCTNFLSTRAVTHQACCSRARILSARPELPKTTQAPLHRPAAAFGPKLQAHTRSFSARP